jgi:pimeloyl-ACP methyl ester carboxylesterase
LEVGGEAQCRPCLGGVTQKRYKYDVIILDQRSHGESEKVPFGLKVARLSKDLFELVTALSEV